MNIPDIKAHSSVNLPVNENEVKKTSSWQGHQLYVSSNQKTLWITRFASAIILVLGITLIAALSTAGAIAGGVVCILTATAILLYTVVMPHFREKFHEFGYLTEIKKEFQFEKINDLPKIQAHLTDKQIKVLISPEHLTQDQVFRGDISGNKKVPFVLTIIKTPDNSTFFKLFSFGRMYRKKDFVIECQGEQLPLPKEPVVIPTFSNAIQIKDNLLYPHQTA